MVSFTTESSPINYPGFLDQSQKYPSDCDKNFERDQELKTQNHVNSQPQIIANIRFFGKKENSTYNVKIPAESRTNPVVTLAQLKKKLPAKNPLAYTYYFQSEQNGEFFEEATNFRESINNSKFIYEVQGNEHEK